MAISKQKTKVEYVCSNCGYTTNTWTGKCSNCGEWNTLEEKTVVVKSPKSLKQGNYTPLELADNADLVDLAELYERKSNQSSYAFHAPILNDFWGEGIVKGSLTLLAGEPGLGKSTFALQILRSIVTAKSDTVCWYISGEESNTQFGMRAKRLGIPDSIVTLQTSNWNVVQDKLTANKPDFIILDSIQTIYDPELGSAPGSVAQVSSLASKILYLCKSLGITCVIIGHVTKDGSIAGPKTLEHLVDSVLNLERSSQLGITTLSFSKHRFGSTQQLILLKMEEEGLQIITNPSLALLENLEHGIGVTYGMTLDRNLPLVIEIQSLVTQPYNRETPSYGRRETQGIKSSKLNIILAIIEKYLHIDLKGADVYVQVNGLTGKSDDPNLDLAILLSILSSYINKPVNDMFSLTKAKPIFFARLTLSGSIRKSTSTKQLQSSSSKLGFEPNPNIEFKSLEYLSKLLRP